MHCKTLLLAFVLGIAFPGEAAARGGFGQGTNNGFSGHGNGQGNGQTSGAAANATTTAAAAAQSTGTASNGGGNGGSNLELNPDAVQTGSQSDGTQASGSASGQAASNTDPANFINFCAGKTLTNGLQVKGGSCNGIVMGQIPASTQMVSTIITFPQNGQVISDNQTFTLSANIQNIQAGSFTNPDATYYAAPQELNSAGQVIGHMHFSVQALGDSLNPTTAPDPTKFAFFKGVDDAGDGKGNLQATVTGGLAAGNYRVCTMSSSSNHQPVLMPVAQRGAQDDCTKFTVGGGGGGNAGSGSNTSASASASATTAATAAGSSSTATAASSSSTATASAGTGNNGNKGVAGGAKGGKGGKGGNRARFVRDFRG